MGRLEAIRKELEHDQVPLSFYGRAVDQDGAGVDGATVTLTYTHFDLTVPQYHFLGEGSRSMKTDQQGFFTVSGIKGYGLAIKVSKEGYLASKRNFPGANYVHVAKPFSPDLSKPVVYLLRKKGVPVPLVSSVRNYVLRRDGAPLSVDLMTGETNGTNPDITIQLWVDDTRRHGNSGRFDWRAKVEVLNGGGLETTDEEFGYTAPGDGYVDSAELGYSISDTNKPWSDAASQTYYLKLRGGSMYGRMELQMVPGGDHFCLIRSSLNPSGSRNLESDGTLRFRDVEEYNRYIAAHPQAAK